MSLLYQKTKLLGRMFRGGYEGEGTGIDLGGPGGDGPGSGWGGFSAGDTAQFGTPEAPAGSLGGYSGGSSGGKPGESNMAQAQAQQNLTPLSDRPDTRDQTGWYSGNESQTVAQLERNQALNDALTAGVPMAMSMVAPGWGTAMLAGKSFAKLMNGVPAEEVVTDAAKAVLPGYINGQINKATGGILGQATMAGNVLNSLTGSPQVPNIGREIVGGIIGRQSGGGMQAAQPATSMASDGNGESTTTAQQATPAPAAQPAPVQSDVNYASLGIDSAGWTRAGRKYLEKRNGMV